MENWRNEAVTGDLLQVPGLGPAAIKMLGEAKVTNTYQLVGTYLSLKGPEDEEHEVSVGALNQKFWFFLKSAGIKSHRSAIVLAVYEKVSSFFPGFYDATADATAEEEESSDEE